MGRLSSKLLGTYECPQEKLPFFYSSRHLKNKFLHKSLSMQQALYKIINILLQKPSYLSFVQKFSLLCPHFQSTSVRVNTEVFLLLHFFFHDVNRIPFLFLLKCTIIFLVLFPHHATELSTSCTWLQ